jgi:S1-C subfamily serine protease
MLTNVAPPRVSRETRRLLAAAALALLALWILARLRFPERPASANPVATVLTQIAPPTTFADLAAEVDGVRRRVAPTLSEVTWPVPQAPGGARTFPAWPFRDQLAIALLPVGIAPGLRDGVIAIDPPTGLALVRATAAAALSRPIWIPDQLDLPRYLFAAVPAPLHPTVVPAYVSLLEPVRSPAWPSEIWRVPAGSGLIPGSFIFTAAGQWLGIATEENGQPVIVPAAALFDAATRMSAQQDPPAGDPGVEVQNLTPALATATGASTGVIVTSVDSAGPAAEVLVVGDVIEQVNGDAVPTPLAWHVRWTRLAAGASARLRVHRRGKVFDVEVAVPPRAARSDGLGLTLAWRAGVGSQVLEVASGSAADRAGLEVGDVVTRAGEQSEPTPAQVRLGFAAVPDGGVALLAIRRDTTQRLVILPR